MENAGIIPEISSFQDLLKKLEYDLKRYSKNNHSYEFIDCIMSLNALPEWIKNTTNISDDLKELAREKELIMKGNNGFQFDEAKLEFDIDQQLRFIRLYCNHSKHKTDSGHIPRIVTKYGATFPMTLPAKFYNIVAIGQTEFDAEFLLNNTYVFGNRILKIKTNTNTGNRCTSPSIKRSLVGRAKNYIIPHNEQHIRKRNCSVRI